MMSRAILQTESAIARGCVGLFVFAFAEKHAIKEDGIVQKAAARHDAVLGV